MLQQRTLVQSVISLWHHLRRQRKSQFFLLLGLMLLASAAEMVSIGAVLPFLGALINPEQVFRHPAAQSWVSFLALQQPQEIVFFLTVLFCVAAVSACALRLVLLYAMTRFSFSVGADFSLEVYRRTLYQPYAVHIGRNSSEIINGIIGKIAMLIGSILIPLLTLMSSAILLLGVLLMLLQIDPVIAITAGLSFGLLYLVTALLSRSGLRDNSERIARESTQVIKALQEGLGGIRDVLIDGTQDAYCAIYRKADRAHRQAQSRNIFASASPRYIMEMLGMVMIALLAYSMALREGGMAAALPVLGALALGAQRLLPALQQGYNALATIFGAEASMRDGLELLAQPMPENAGKRPSAPIHFEHEIRLTKIGFRYGSSGSWVLRGVELVIPKGSRVGFIGTTGTGKSTLLDLVMSLLTPVEGTLAIDGVTIGFHNQRAWQAHIAHVPQSIYLADSSIEENIAFGIPYEKIDRGRVRDAARKAQIADTIDSWPERYRTAVGERGVRLSGGQRQRIGIARALYKQADVIIFDEATSALDSETEKAVMESIDKLGDGLTILIVAHRLTTLRNSDFIVSLGSDGSCRTGQYQELATTR